MTTLSLLFGAVARDDKTLLLWETVREHLAPAGIALDYVIHSSYDRLAEGLSAARIDVALLSPLAHVRARRRGDARVTPVAMRDVDREFSTRVVARRDADIRALAGLEGKTLAVGARDAAHARILPLFYLKRAGVDLAKVTLLPFDRDIGKHGDPPGAELEVLAAVHAGRAQAGVVGTAVWQTELAAGRVDQRIVEPLWSTPTFSRHVIDAAPNLAPASIQLFQRALFDLRWSNAKHRKVLELGGQRMWCPAREEGYADLALALNEV